MNIRLTITVFYVDTLQTCNAIQVFHSKNRDFIALSRFMCSPELAIYILNGNNFPTRLFVVTTRYSTLCAYVAFVFDIR